MGMRYLKEGEERLEKHPHVRYATNVTLKQANRHVGTMCEEKPY